MSLVDAQTLVQMRADEALSLHDKCIVQTCTETQDGYGQPVASYADGSEIACGFKATGGREVTRADGTILITDAAVRLPLSVTVSVKDRIKVTERHGSDLATALVFEVAALARRGASGLVIDLRAVS
jgi:head-tail adaptor